MKKMLILIRGLIALVMAYPCVYAEVAAPKISPTLFQGAKKASKTRVFRCFNYRMSAKERKIGKVVSKETLAAMHTKELAKVEIPSNQFARDAAYYCKKQYKLAATAVISVIDGAGKLAFVGTSRLTPKETARLDIKKVKFSKDE